MPRDTGKVVLTYDLTLDTAAYVAGDVLGDLLEITPVIWAAGRPAVLESIHVIDIDDQKQAFDIVIFDRSVTMQAKNAAWNVSDADMKFSQGIVRVVAADYVDLGPNSIATRNNLKIGVKPNAGTSLFIGTLSQGTGTYTAAGIRLVFTFLRG